MNKMTHSCHHKIKTDIWNNSIRNTNLLHPFLCPWSPTALYIAWTSAFKTRATIVQALFFMHNSIYKGKILNNPQIWDFSLLPPTTLNSNYNSAFRSSKIAEESSPYSILQSVIYSLCKRMFREESLFKRILLNPILLAPNSDLQLLEPSHWLRFFFHISSTVFLQKKSK